MTNISFCVIIRIAKYTEVYMTEQEYRKQDAALEIQKMLAEKEAHGGRVTIENGEYNICSSVVVDASSLCFSGEM